MRHLSVILFICWVGSVSAQVQLYNLAPADSTTTHGELILADYSDFIGITTLDTIGIDDYLQIYKKLFIEWTYKPDSVCLQIIDDGRDPTCFHIDTVGGVGPGTDTYTFSGVYADDTITIYRTDDGVTVIDSFKVGIPPCPYELVSVDDTTIALLDCLGDTISTVNVTGAGLQSIFTVPSDTSFMFVITYNDGVTPKDTIEFLADTSLMNDKYLDSLAYVGDTLTAYIADTSGIIDSIKVAIVSDTDIDSVALIGNVLHIYEDDKDRSVDLSQFLDDTDDQVLSLSTDGQIDTLFIQDGNFVVFHDSVGVDTDDQTIDVFTFDNGTRTLSISLEDDGEATKTVVIPDDTGTDDQILSIVTDGQIDTLILEDGGFIVLHDSVGVSSVVGYNGLSNQAPDSIKLGGQLIEDTHIRGNEDLPGLNEYSLYLDTLKNFNVTASTQAYIRKIRDKTLSNNLGYMIAANGQTANFYYDFDVNAAGRFFLNNSGAYMSWGDTASVASKSHLYMNDSGIYINPERQVQDLLVDSMYILSSIDSLGRAQWKSAKALRLLDYDFIRLHGDTMMTTVDTLLPLDSADLHKLIWHGGRVRLGDEAYYPSIYQDLTTLPSITYKNTVLEQDSASETGLQIYGRRSAIDIYHITRPYIHVRNSLGEFYHRVFDPTGEGPLEPQRYEIGAVGAYDTDDMGTMDTTKRSIFTIMNNADAYSLNITNNFLQSDIYTSARTPDTSSVFGMVAADSSGRFILLQLDSIGNINLVNPPDSDWLAIPTYDIPEIDQDKFTLGKVRIGQDSLESSSVTVMINGGAIPFVTKSTTSVNLFRMETRPNNMAWDFRASDDFEFKHQDLTAATTGTYMYYDGGYTSSSAIIYLQNDGDIRFNNYLNTRNDLELSDSILNIYYPDETGRLNMASIDSLAAALAATGIISSADSLGRNGNAGRLVFETATKASNSDSKLYWDKTDKELAVGHTTTPGAVLDVRGDADVAKNTAFFAANQTSTSFTSSFAGFYSANVSGITNSWARVNFGDGSSAAAAALGVQITNTASDYGDMTIWTRSAAGFTEKIRVGSTGSIQFNLYNSTNNVGVPTYLLGTDASGNVVKRTFDNVEADMGGPFIASSATLFIAAGNSGTPENITLGETLDIIGGDSDITTEISGGNVVISIPANAIQSAEISNGEIYGVDMAMTAPGAGQDEYYLTYEHSTGGWELVSGLTGGGIYGGSGTIAASAVATTSGSGFRFDIETGDQFSLNSSNGDATYEFILADQAMSLRTSSGVKLGDTDNLGSEIIIDAATGTGRIRHEGFTESRISLDDDGDVHILAQTAASGDDIYITADDNVSIQGTNVTIEGLSFSSTSIGNPSGSMNIESFTFNANVLSSTGDMTYNNGSGSDHIFQANGTTILTLDPTTSDGQFNMLIGDNNTRQLLISSNATYAEIRNEASTAGYWRIDGVGDITEVDASDRRLKDNIREIDDPYSKIMSLNPVVYNMKSKPDQIEYGFIAQDYINTFPEHTYLAENGLYGIDYKPSYIYSVAAIQQLIKDNEQQAAQIALLTEQINKLYSIINKK